MFVIVLERALDNVHAIGPFEHQEQAADYMTKHHKFPDVWRIAKLDKPEDK